MKEILRPLRPLYYSLAKRLGSKDRPKSYPELFRSGRTERPHYAYCVYHAAVLAKRLGYPRISAIEFGVAGGNGLVNLEWHAREISRWLSIGIDVYGFDTGKGLPKPVDHRDLPYHWKEGFFSMDEKALRSRLTDAKLLLGDVGETVQRFFAEHRPAPVGAVIYDLDFYSSTAAALGLFDGEEKYLLPRIYCYFDDVIGSEVELYNDYTGVRLAIHEFNRTRAMKKIATPYHLLCRNKVESWYHQISIYHDFSHAQYNDFVSEESQELPLSDE